MMKLQENKKIVKVIETTKGHIYSPFSCPQQKTVKLAIFNELFTPQCSKVKTNIPLELQHLNHHKQNPNSLQNTSIGWASLQHQLREILSRTSLTERDVLIFESSNYNQKIPQIFNRFQIVKGFNYRLKLQSLNNISEDKIALMNEEHVLKQVEMEFSLGNGTFKPGYIGEITFEEIGSPIFQGITKAYVNYASKTQCPIVINFSCFKSQEIYNVVFQQQSKQIIDLCERKLQILNNFLLHAKQKNCARNIIIYNLPILLIHDNSFSSANNYFAKHIQRLITEYNVTIGFKLLRYSKFNQKDGIDQIIKLVQKYPKNTILSSGIKYKTDLTVNSGQGLSLYEYYQPSQSTSLIHMNSIQYMKHFLPHQVLDQVIRQNILELFDWKEKKQEIKVEVFWKCDTCKGDFSQTVEAFQKFGKRFCSIKCLKSHKF